MVEEILTLRRGRESEAGRGSQKDGTRERRLSPAYGVATQNVRSGAADFGRPVKSLSSTN